MGSASASGTGNPGAGNRVGQIDSLRCFAMSAVVAQHCGLLPLGWTGVWLFFVISGYVVTCTVVGRSSDQPPARRLASFFRRRIMRIVPVYYAYVLAGVLVSVGSAATFARYDLAALLGFFHNIAMGEGRGLLADWPVSHLWTISVEMQFYLVYGTALILAPRRAVVYLLFAALLVAPAARLSASWWFAGLGLDSETSAFRIYSGPFLHIDAFAAGGLLAFAAYNATLTRLSRPLAVWGFAALLLYCVSYFVLNRLAGAHGLDTLRNIVSGVLWGQYREVFVYSAVAAPAAGLVALAATNDPWVSWLLRHRLLQRVGEISYGAYIFHVLGIAAAAYLLGLFVDLSAHPVMGRLALFALSYTATIAAAELSFRTFKARFLNKRARAIPAPGKKVESGEAGPRRPVTSQGHPHRTTEAWQADAPPAASDLPHTPLSWRR